MILDHPDAPHKCNHRCSHKRGTEGEEGQHSYRGRDWSAAVTARNASSLQQLGKASKDPPPELLGGVKPCQHFDFGLLVSRAVSEYISVVLSHQLCGNVLQQL